MPYFLNFILCVGYKNAPTNLQLEGDGMTRGPAPVLCDPGLLLQVGPGYASPGWPARPERSRDVLEGQEPLSAGWLAGVHFDDCAGPSRDWTAVQQDPGLPETGPPSSRIRAFPLAFPLARSGSSRAQSASLVPPLVSGRNSLQNFSFRYTVFRI